MPAGGGAHPQTGFQKGHPPYKRKKIVKPPKPPRLNRDGTPRKPHVVGRPFVKGQPAPGTPYKKGENTLNGVGPNRKKVLGTPPKPPRGRSPRDLSMDEHLRGQGFDALEKIVEMLKTPLNPVVRAKLLCEVMSYQYSRRRSVEISGQDSGPIQVVIRRWGETGGAGGSSPAGK